MIFTTASGVHGRMHFFVNASSTNLGAAAAKTKIKTKITKQTSRTMKRAFYNKGTSMNRKYGHRDSMLLPYEEADTEQNGTRLDFTKPCTARAIVDTTTFHTSSEFLATLKHHDA